ncbi:MAG: hypothetical protein V1703_04100, partial [Candidatus Altiarchaeota archaeon]
MIRERHTPLKKNLTAPGYSETYFPTVKAALEAVKRLGRKSPEEQGLLKPPKISGDEFVAGISDDFKLAFESEYRSLFVRGQANPEEYASNVLIHRRERHYGRLSAALVLQAGHTIKHKLEKGIPVEDIAVAIEPLLSSAAKESLLYCIGATGRNHDLTVLAAGSLEVVHTLKLKYQQAGLK